VVLLAVASCATACSRWIGWKHASITSGMQYWDFVSPGYATPGRQANITPAAAKARSSIDCPPR